MIPKSIHDNKRVRTNIDHIYCDIRKKLENINAVDKVINHKDVQNALYRLYWDQLAQKPPPYKFVEHFLGGLRLHGRNHVIKTYGNYWDRCDYNAALRRIGRNGYLRILPPYNSPIRAPMFDCESLDPTTIKFNLDQLIILKEHGYRIETLTETDVAKSPLFAMPYVPQKTYSYRPTANPACLLHVMPIEPNDVICKYANTTKLRKGQLYYLHGLFNVRVEEVLGDDLVKLSRPIPREMWLVP